MLPDSPLKMYLVVPHLFMILLFGFSYLFNCSPNILNGKFQKFMSFKLCPVLSNVMKSHNVCLCLAHDMTHPFF